MKRRDSDFLTIALLLLTSAALVQMWVMMWLIGTVKITEHYWYVRAGELAVFVMVMGFSIWRLVKFFREPER